MKKQLVDLLPFDDILAHLCDILVRQNLSLHGERDIFEGDR